MFVALTPASAPGPHTGLLQIHLRAEARGVVRGLEVLEVLHRAAPAAGVRHQSEPDLVLAVAVVLCYSVMMLVVTTYKK